MKRSRRGGSQEVEENARVRRGYDDRRARLHHRLWISHCRNRTSTLGQENLAFLRLCFFVGMVIPAVRRARSDRCHQIELLVPCNEEQAVTGRLPSKARKSLAPSQYVNPHMIPGEGRCDDPRRTNQRCPQSRSWPRHPGLYSRWPDLPTRARHRVLAAEV